MPTGPHITIWVTLMSASVSSIPARPMQRSYPVVSQKAAYRYLTLHTNLAALQAHQATGRSRRCTASETGGRGAPWPCAGSPPPR